MRKLLTILLVCFAFIAQGQTYTPMTAAGYQFKRGMFDSTLHIPSVCGVPTLRDLITKKSAIAFDSCNNLLYTYNPKTLTWNSINGGGVSTITVSGDTLFICNFNSCDTAISTVSGGLVTILNDSTLQVCPADPDLACDTLHVPRTQFASSLWDSATVYNVIYNLQNYLADTAFTNQFMPNYGVVIQNFARINDSVTVHVRTDGIPIYDTLRHPLTQENINSWITIRNYEDSLEGPDTTFHRVIASDNNTFYVTVGTDPLSRNDTVYYHVPSYVTTSNPNGFVITPVVTWLHDYVYNVSAGSGYIDNVLYNWPSTDITLTAADATNDRIDLFVATTSSTYDKVTGTAAATPVEPDYDANTNLRISFALVYHGTTEPPTGSNWIYKENTEWTTSVFGGTINAASTNNPYAGSKDVEGTNVVNANFVQFTSPSTTIDFSKYNYLTFQIRSKGNFSTTKKLVLRWLSAPSNATGNNVPIGSGSYGFVSTQTTQYQTISIPLSDFGNIGTAYILRLTESNTSGNAGWYIDNIQLQYIQQNAPNNEVVFYGKNTTRDSTILILKNGTRFAAKDSTGSGVASVGNVGTGYALSTGSSIKRLGAGVDVLIDSTTTANTITIKADTTAGNTHLATQGDITNAVNAIPASSGTDSAAYHTISQLPDSSGFVIIRPNGTRDTVVTTSSTTGIGMVTGLTPKPILFGSSAGLIQQDTTITVDSLNTNHTRTLRVGTVVSDDYNGKTIQFMGNSITQVSTSGASDAGHTYPAVAEREFAGFGMTGVNLGQSGSTIVSHIGVIPSKTSSMRILSLMYGSNEMLDTVTYTHAFFVTSFKKFLDTAIARGWQGNQIVVNSIPGANYNLPQTTNAKEREFNAVMDSLSTVYGCYYNDIYERYLIPEISNYAGTQILHPGDYAHEIMGKMVAGAIKGSFTMTDQKLAVNGTTQLSKLILKNSYFINKGHILGQDSLGNVGAIYALPANIRSYGRIYPQGAIIYATANLPTDRDTVKDIIIPTAGRIASALQAGGTQIGSYTPMTSGGSSRLYNGTSTGSINLDVSGQATGGSLTAISLSPDGTTSFGRNIFSPWTYKYYSSSGVFYAGLTLLTTTDGYTTLSNKTPTGKFQLFMSNGLTSSDSVQAMEVDYRGNAKYQTGGTYANTPSAKFAVNTATQPNIFQGVLLPVVTQSQRDSILKPISTTLTISNAGTGYGTASVPITFSSPTGSIQATGTANAVAGSITATQVLTTGAYSTTAPTITVGGAGTGAVITATLQSFPAGLEIYCSNCTATDTSTGVKQVWNGSTWKNAW